MKAMKDEGLAADESRRIAQHEAIKGDVREEVHGEIRRGAGESTPVERASTEALADTLKQKAVREVSETESELERAKGVARVSQIVDYLFYLAYGLIGLEIALELFGAREGAPFKRFVDALAAPVLAPFSGLMPDPGVGPFRLMVSYIVALVVYVLLHMAVNGLLRLFVHRKAAV